MLAPQWHFSGEILHMAVAGGLDMYFLLVNHLGLT